jgi:Putative phage tail protein
VSLWPFHHKRKPKKNIAATPQILQGLSLSSSAVGLAIPLVYGQARLPGNLIHYKQQFLASGNSDPATAAIAMALCEGPIAGVLKAYDGRDQTDSQTDVFNAGQHFTPGVTTSLTLSRTPISGTVYLTYPLNNGIFGISAVVGNVVNFTTAIPSGTSVVVLSYQYPGSLATRGFTTFLGTLSQAAWGFLTTNYPAEAVPYELTAYLANDHWPIPNNQLENWSFEVQGLSQWGSGVVDANPRDIVFDFLTDSNHGVLLPSSLIASLNDFRDYCTAAGIFLSPVFDTQRPAADYLQEILAVANSAFVWSDGKLKVVPYADTPVTGHSVTYTPNTTPLYDLTDDDFIADGEDPVRVTRRAQSDVYNQIQVEFDNRAYDYNGDIAEAKDQASIEQFGLKPAPVIKAPFIKDAALARFVAQLALQRQVYIRNTYEFTLGFRYVLLEPMDLVTLTDANLGLNQTTVRLTQVEEQDDGSFMCIGEEWPFGVATATAYTTGSTTPLPRVFPAKIPGQPGITVSFDASGQAILNLTGDLVTASHKWVIRTDRLPTLLETRAGTVATWSAASSIATGVVVAAGAAVYVGDLAYSSDNSESQLSTGTFPREGSGTSAPPVAIIENLDTDDDNLKWMLRFRADAGSGGGGTNLTYVINKKVGKGTTTLVESGNATAFPRDRSIVRNKGMPTNVILTVTDVATGLKSTANMVLPPWQFYEPDYGQPEEERQRAGDGGIPVPTFRIHALPLYDSTGSTPLIDTAARRFQTALGGPTGIGGDVIERGGNKGDQAIDSGISVVAGAIDFVRTFVNKHLGNIPDDGSSDRRAATLNQKTGGDRGLAAIDSGNVVVTTSVDLSRAYTGKHLGNIPDDGTSDRKAVTGNEKTGAGRAFPALDSSNKLQTGVTAGATAGDGETGIDSFRGSTRRSAQAAGTGVGQTGEENTRSGFGGYPVPSAPYLALPHYDSSGSVLLLDPATRRLQAAMLGPAGTGMDVTEDGGNRGIAALEVGGVIAQGTTQRNGTNPKNVASGRYTLGTGTHTQSISFPANYQNPPAVNILGGISYQPASLWGTSGAADANPQTGVAAPNANAQVDEVVAYNVTTSGASLRARLRQASATTAWTNAFPGTHVTANGGTSVVTSANAPAANDTYTASFTYAFESTGVPGKACNVSATVSLDYWNGSAWINVASATYTASDPVGGDALTSGSDALVATVSGLISTSQLRLRLGTNAGAGSRTYDVGPGNLTYTTTTGDQYTSKTPAALGINLNVEVIGAS